MFNWLRRLGSWLYAAFLFALSRLDDIFFVVGLVLLYLGLDEWSPPLAKCVVGGILLAVALSAHILNARRASEEE